MEKAETSMDNAYADSRSLLGRLKRILRFWRLRLQRLTATPHQIGMGVATGVFAGYLPILPMQTILALILAWLVKGNKIAAALATSVTNPLTSVPFHLLYYRIGKALVPFEVVPISPALLEPAAIVQSGWQLYMTLCTGALVIAVPSALLSYFLARRCAEVYQKRKRMPRNLEIREYSDNEQ